MERVTGVDVARGLAVLGMFAAHVGYAEPELFTATGWLAVADGRSAALFAVLAGVSIALMSGGPEPGDLGDLRRRLAVRAALLLGIGYVLVALGTPIAIILPSYAVMFVLALPAVGARAPAALVAGTGVLVVVPSLLVAYRESAPATNELTDLLATGYYPALAWVGYVLVGLGVGRLPLREHAVAGRLLLAGAATAVLGYGNGFVLESVAPRLEPFVTIEPHADTTPEMLGNAGVAVAVLGGCLLASRVGWLRTALHPVAATGAMPLTVYCVQVVAVALMGPAVVWAQTTNGTLLAFTAVTLAACTLWRRWLGSGPLERFLRAAANAAIEPRREPVRR